MNVIRYYNKLKTIIIRIVSSFIKFGNSKINTHGPSTNNTNYIKILLLILRYILQRDNIVTAYMLEPKITKHFPK